MAFVPKTKLGHFAPNALSPETPDFDNPYYINYQYDTKYGHKGYSPGAPIQYIPGHTAPDGSIFSNCVGYAISRFMEIGGFTNYKDTKHLSQNGDGVYSAAEDEGRYKVGKIPQVGAIVGWFYNSGRGGHVAVVEKVESNGDIIISHSGYYGNPHPKDDPYTEYGTGGGFVFHVDKLFASNNYDLVSAWHNSAYSSKCQGFVYNPMNGEAPPGATIGSSSLILDSSRTLYSNFKSIILSEVSKTSMYSVDKLRELMGLRQNDPLSAPFVRYCLSQIVSGEEDKLVFNSKSASTIVQSSVDADLGFWYPFDSNEDIYVGDIICLGNNTKYRGNTGFIDRVGIVTKYTNGIITYSGADFSNVHYDVKIKEDDPTYFGIYRPKYETTTRYIQCSQASGYGNLNSSVAMLYDSHNTNKDATLLQVGSINPLTAKPLINIEGNTKLSVINYTSALGALIAAYYSNIYSPGVGLLSTDMSYMQAYAGMTLKAGVKYKFVDPVDFDGQHSAYLNTCGSIIYTYFANLGYPPASICGMMSAFWAEDHFDYTNQENPDASSEGNGWGLGNWTDHSGRRSDMVKFAQARGKNWKQDIYVQLEYIYWELTNRSRFYDLNLYLMNPNKYDTYLGSNVNTSQVAYAVGARFSTSYVGGSYWDLHLNNGVPNMTIQEVEESYRRKYASVTPAGYDIIYTHVHSGVWMFEHNLVPVVTTKSDDVENLEM